MEGEKGKGSGGRGACAPPQSEMKRVACFGVGGGTECLLQLRWIGGCVWGVFFMCGAGAGAEV